MFACCVEQGCLPAVWSRDVCAGVASLLCGAGVASL